MPTSLFSTAHSILFIAILCHPSSNTTQLCMHNSYNEKIYICMHNSSVFTGVPLKFHVIITFQRGKKMPQICLFEKCLLLLSKKKNELFYKSLVYIRMSAIKIIRRFLTKLVLNNIYGPNQIFQFRNLRTHCKKLYW